MLGRRPFHSGCVVLASNGDVRAAMTTWGISESQIDRTCDPRRALAFYSLLTTIRSSLKAQNMEETDLLWPSIAITKIVESNLH